MMHVILMADYAYEPKRKPFSKKAQAKLLHVAPAKTARARITGVNASYKDLAEVCRSVRGKDTEYALEFLNDAAVKKKAIYFARHATGKGHRKELGGRIGGFPIKSVKIVLEVVKNAVANATRLGLGSTKIVHIIANKQDTYPRMSPKGRRIVHNYETAFVEVVLEEFQQKVAETKKEKKTEAKKPVEAKPTGIKAVETKKTEEEIKKQEMSSTDKHRPIENRKLEPAHKEEQRI